MMKEIIGPTTHRDHFGNSLNVSTERHSIFSLFNETKRAQLPEAALFHYVSENVLCIKKFRMFPSCSRLELQAGFRLYFPIIRYAHCPRGHGHLEQIFLFVFQAKHTLHRKKSNDD